MNTELLQQLGLTSVQAKAYMQLIQSGEVPASELAKQIGETRTNTYMVLDKLIAMALVEKREQKKVATFRATNPTNLEKLTTEKKNSINSAESAIKAAMPQLLSYYFTFSSEPGVRFYQGKEGIIKVYEDILRTKKPVYLIRTPSEQTYLGEDFMQKYIDKRVKLAIPVEAITPDIPAANHDKSIDESMLFHRTWFDKASYNAPVEINIYGDKVAYVSFGEEAIATIIDSPQIATAMKQLFGLMQLGAEQTKKKKKTTKQLHQDEMIEEE